MCVKEPCVYLLSAASVVIRNTSVTIQEPHSTYVCLKMFWDLVTYVIGTDFYILWLSAEGGGELCAWTLDSTRSPAYRRSGGFLKTPTPGGVPVRMTSPTIRAILASKLPLPLAPPQIIFFSCHNKALLTNHTTLFLPRSFSSFCIFFLSRFP